MSVTNHSFSQGVVTYMSPIEAFATAIKMFDRQILCLIAWSFSFWGSWSLDFSGSKVKSQPHIFDLLILATRRPPWSLDRPPLIAWFNFDPGCKRFYAGHISDYPLFSGPPKELLQIRYLNTVTGQWSPLSLDLKCNILPWKLDPQKEVCTEPLLILAVFLSSIPAIVTSVAISKQLNVKPYLRGVHEPFPFTMP